MPLIRPSTEHDLPAITRIYAHHVLHGTGTFETTRVIGASGRWHRGTHRCE